MRVHTDKICFLYPFPTPPEAYLSPEAATHVDIPPPAPAPNTDTSHTVVIPPKPAPSTSTLGPLLQRSTCSNRLVPAQDVHFFYTRSHLSALPNCALIFSTNSQFIFIFK